VVRISDGCAPTTQWTAPPGYTSWSFQSSASGGTLSIHGTQVLGWAVHEVIADYQYTLVSLTRRIAGKQGRPYLGENRCSCTTQQCRSAKGF
jgi:hypothetical protein